MSDGRWLLVVDDDRDIRAVIEALLGWEGYAVVTAYDGLDALEKIRARGHPALVLLDLRMPRMSGAEFVAALRAEMADVDVPVIVISGDWRARESAQALSVAGFLAKPFDSTELVRSVRRLVPMR